MSRPLPATPGAYPGYAGMFDRQEMYGRPSGYFVSNPYSPTLDNQTKPTTSRLNGTLLHKGFYDLLAMIPTPSPSRLLWGPPAPPPDPVLAGPRYEHIPPGLPPTISETPIKPSSPSSATTAASTSPLRKGRRISKDMVSNPTGFVHLVHASDAYQAEALLTRWGPDGLGKLGDPRWANPIKNRVRQNTRARAINEVVRNMKQSPEEPVFDDGRGPLRVVNGISTATSSTLTTAARENVQISPTSPSLEGIPGGRPGNSTIRWAGGLQAHPEEQEHAPESTTNLNPAPPSDSDHDPELIISPEPELLEDEVESFIQPPPPKPITPSLATLEKAVSARIYFENLYFPLFRHPPSREQRRLAMERDMKEMQLSHAQKENLRARWRQNETEYLRERRKKVDVSGFIKLKTIGHGAFGVVSLVKERSTGSLYAMKQLRKTDMLRKGQEGHVRAERDILKSASLVQTPGGAEWIVRLHYSFQDQDHLYLVLEYMGGGDLLNLLIERDIFEEDFTRFYIAEMILAIESCHKHGFIHRDIKPDNFLFDPEGHVKLSDFGLATDLHWAHDTSYYEQQRLHLLHKHGIDLDDGNGLADGRKTKRMDRKEVEALMGGGDGTGGLFTWREKNRRKLAYSVCGTNSYMSPEVIRGHGYTYSCDWWSLGVIMFECLYGYPPFVSKSRHDTRKMILNWKQYLKFPTSQRRTGEGQALARVSHEGVSLMKQLLCEPEDRLGSQATASVSRPDSLIVQQRRSGFGPPPSVDGAELIKAHPWFRGIDWQNIHKYPAPYMPGLAHPEDTRHFDDDIPAEPLAPANGAPPDLTRDPMLRDKLHGEEILHVRKALAFAGFTHKSPRAISYVRADKAFDPLPNTYGQTPQEELDDPINMTHTVRGRPTLRQRPAVGRGRPLSL